MIDRTSGGDMLRHTRRLGGISVAPRTGERWSVRSPHAKSPPVGRKLVHWRTQMATDFARQDYAHSEGRVAKTIEDQTARLPSDAFLWMAVGSMAVSATLQMMGNRHVSLFVGQWAPTFLIFGLYNKLVKQLGSDRTENAV
jgi:hypothetical protein